MKYVCQFCHKQLASKSSLNNHIANAMYCIKTRSTSDGIRIFKCEGCSRNYASKQMRDVHMIKCRKLIAQKLTQKYEEIIEGKESQIFKLEEKIQDLQNKLENIALKAVSRSTTTNNINAIIQRLEPVTDEYIASTVPQLTIEHIKKGPEGYAEYALKHPFKNRVVCVDYSRRKIKYKDENGEVVADPEMNKLASKFFKSIKDHNNKLIDEYVAQLHIEDVEKLYADLSVMADYRKMVGHAADGEKTNMYHEFVKNVCTNSI